MKPRKNKTAQIPTIRCTAAMEARLTKWWSEIRKLHPDMSYSSAIRELLRRGLDAGA